MPAEKIIKGYETAFIDSNIECNELYKPEFIYNDNKKAKKVLSEIKKELLSCEEFIFSVAFITMSGITPLLNIFQELKEKGVKGKILTTNYLNFSEPKALQTLAELGNVEIRMFHDDRDGFHTKGYIFKKGDVYKLILGSSNLTQKAMTQNKEWNSKLVSTAHGQYTQELLTEFNSLWAAPNTKVFEEFIEAYQMAYTNAKRARYVMEDTKVIDYKKVVLQPNMMQREFLSNLLELVEGEERKALLLSATGTGKTYAAAFAARELAPKKILFLVHREDILRKALQSFKNVIGPDKRWGLLSATKRDFDADYLFATMNMMSKDETLNRYSKDEFDLIVIDEAHRAGGNSYQKIINYFEPKLLLGMTATPERTDGYDVYQLFDHNIAYEIRLQKAMEENLLCPFHYFGISDLTIDGIDIDDESGLKNFNLLVSDTRVDYILDKINYYNYSGERVKGLIFCSRLDEAKKLSELFNDKGYRTTVLSGESSQEQREEAISRLSGNNRDEALDYIFTVDIFNEGVDIPEVNQVVMLRPTESAIVFVQQLGRGLRKCVDKEYVVILDFIGNYSSNYLIPVALSDDRSYNKDNIRRYVMEGERILPGASTIQFDEISRKRIFESIDNANIKSKVFKEKYFEIKQKLGRVPTMADFSKFGGIDPMLLVEYKKTYHKFCKWADADYVLELDNDQNLILEFLSNHVINGKRIHELEIVKKILEPDEYKIEEFNNKEIIYENKELSNYESAVNLINKQFMNTQTEKDKFREISLLNTEKLKQGVLQRSAMFANTLNRKEFKNEINDLIEFGLLRNKEKYSKHNEDYLVLYEKYSRKDVCRILNWITDDTATMYGYRIKYDTCPIFVTYHKTDDISSSTKYDDTFIDHKTFSWMTRSKVRETSGEAQSIINHKENQLAMHLFVKKSDNEGTDFYYMGKVKPVKWKETKIINDKGKELPIMNFTMELEHVVRDDIYDYFTAN